MQVNIFKRIKVSFLKEFTVWETSAQQGILEPSVLRWCAGTGAGFPGRGGRMGARWEEG